MVEHLEGAIVRVGARGKTSGLGFLVDRSRVVTCAHVVASALDLGENGGAPARARIDLEFVLLPGCPGATASIEHFNSVDATGPIDVAVLRLDTQAPLGAVPADMVWEDSLWGHALAAFGFPADYEEGTWVSGVFRGRQASGWVQVEDTKATGYRLEPGYSGGPAWDVDMGAVAGLVVAADRNPTTKAGWVIPTALLKQASPDLPVDRPVVAGHRDTFVRRLSEANYVSVIGFTNQRLVDYIEEALAYRNKRGRGPWEHVRIVFLDPMLLSAVDDELEGETEDAATERRQRFREGARILNSLFLREPIAVRWELRCYPYLLPFVGGLFTLPGGESVGELATLRPPHSVSQYLYFSLAKGSNDLPHYQAVFEHVWNRSRRITEEVVVVGEPVEDGFLCRGFAPRRRVLTGKRSDWHWLAAVIVVAWENRSDGAVPLLNINTRSNSTREIGRISHLSGYLNRKDCAPDDEALEPPFLLDEAMAGRAAQRELVEELGLAVPVGGLLSAGEVRFHYADRENLYFLLVSLEVERGAYMRFGRSAQVWPWTFDRLLAVRRHQVLTGLLDVLGSTYMDERGTQQAVSLLADHLEIHREPELAARVRSDITHGRGELVRDVEALVKESEVVIVVDGVTQTASGLAGLQYREFFTCLLPVYASIGVPGARDYLNWLNANTTAAAARERIRVFYADETAVQELGVDV